MSTPLAIDQYSSHIEPIISNCEEKECHAYGSEFNKALRQEIPDESKKEIINIFNSVVSFMMVPDSPNEPFKPMFIIDNQRGPIPSDLTTEHRVCLEQILPHIADNELKARIADTLWTLKHGKAREHAEIAIESYIASAHNLLKRNWHNTYERLARALRIFLQLGLGNKGVADEKNVVKKILDYIEQEKSANPSFLAMRLIALLHEAGRADNERHAAILEDIATSHESTNHDAARKAWDLAAQLHKRAKKSDDVIRCQSNAAETYVKRADVEENGGQPSYMRISTWLQSAVEAYRHIPGKQQRKDEIYARLIQCQPKIRDEMQVISTEADVSDLVTRAIEAVAGHDAYTALYKFAFLLQPPQLEEIKNEMELQAENAPLSSLFPATFHDQKGRVVARLSPDDSLENKMHRHIADIEQVQNEKKLYTLP